MNTSRSLVVALGALALGGCAVSPEEDPVQIRMNDIDTPIAMTSDTVVIPRTISSFVRILIFLSIAPYSSAKPRNIANL